MTVPASRRATERAAAVDVRVPESASVRRARRVLPGLFRQLSPPRRRVVRANVVRRRDAPWSRGGAAPLPPDAAPSASIAGRTAGRIPGTLEIRKYYSPGLSGPSARIRHASPPPSPGYYPRPTATANRPDQTGPPPELLIWTNLF